VSFTIVPKIKKEFILIARIRSKLINIKAHIFGGHNKLEDSIRNLLRSKINRNTPNRSLKKKTN
jgi:hypothetical protein